MRVAGCGYRDAGCEMQVAGCEMRDARFGMQDVGCGMRDDRYVNMHFEFCDKNSYFVNMIAPKVSIIIVNYNVKYFLENCLLSVLKSVKHVRAEIIVADNHSTDGSSDYFKDRFPQVHFIYLPQNVGFAKANNKALQSATGEYILFLNPDTIIAEDTIDCCIQYMEQDRKAGAIGVQMIDGSGHFLPESKRGLPDTKNSFGKITGLGNIIPNLFGGYYASHLKKDETGPVDVLAGAFFFTRKIILNEIGSFDEQFFMFGEDVDLSYRIQKAGYKNMYLGSTSIIHFKGESSQKKSAAYRKYFFGAMHLFVNKHPHKNKKLLHAAINLHACISTCSSFFSLSEKPISKERKTALICKQDQFTAVIKILKHAEFPVTTMGRMATDVYDKDHCFGNTEQLPVFLKNHMIDQLVICGATVSNKDAMLLIAKFASKVSFLFLQENSSVIVGSNDKNSNGIFIAAN